MKNIEIPQGKRTKFYRFFEILPAFLSYGAIVLMIVLSYFFPRWEFLKKRFGLLWRG
jgi:hypothetical protein